MKLNHCLEDDDHCGLNAADHCKVHAALEALQDDMEARLKSIKLTDLI